jgi:hypothetical protein
MAVVAQTIPEDADADCSGLIEELSIKEWGGVVGVIRHIRNPTSRFVNSLQVVLNGLSADCASSPVLCCSA